MKSSPLVVLLAALAAAGAAHGAGTVTYCSDAAPEGFDIAQYETVATNDAAGLPLYDQLTMFKPGSTEVVPGLAERWEISADGRVYTLQLRHGVKFHSTPWFKPTRDMNADDVMWSLQRLNDPAHPGHAIGRNGYPYWAGMSMPKLIERIAKVSDDTVQITLTHPEAPFIANLAMSSIASVFSAEYAAQLQKAGKLEQINTQPVGTGPYVFKSYQKDAVIRYAAHPQYWGGAPKVDQLIIAITPDPSVRAQRLKAGECQVGWVPGENLAAFEADPRFQVVRTRPLTTTYLAPNSKSAHKFLADKRFREALSLAVDRKAFVQSVYLGLGLPAVNFLPPAIWSYDPSLPIRHDLERARQLVQAAGYDGSELTLFATARASFIQRAVEVLQADLAKIGVKVKPQLMELGELYKRTGRGEHDLALLSWFSDNGDPDNFFTPNLSCAAVEGGGNKSQWCLKAFDDLLAAARATPDVKQRTDLYRRAQRLLFDETGLIPLGNRLIPFAVNKHVADFIPTPFGGSDFRAARLD